MPKMKNVYLDNGATTMVAERVAKEMKSMMTENYGNASSLHSLGENAHKEMEKAREIIAKKLNAKPSEIIFTSGGTESDNIAIRGIAYASKGKHIITTKVEHPAVENTCKELEKEGYEVTYLSVDKEGFIDLNKLKDSIKEDTILVSVIHGNNEIGTLQDLEEIGKICKEKNIHFHSDAVQSFTKTDIDVKKANLTLLSLSAHKIHGPKGTGALFIKTGTKIKPIFHGGSHENKMRAGTENTPGIVGFGKAVEIANDKHIKHMEKLRDKLIKELLKIPDTILNGPKEKRLPNNVNIAFRYIEGESMLYHLDSKGISVSTGSACSSNSLAPSHVLIAIGLKPEIAHGSIRFTLSRYTTEEDIEYTIKNVKEVVENLRKISPLAEGGSK